MVDAKIHMGRESFAGVYGAFDDQVDGSSGAFNQLGTEGPSFPPRDMGGGLGRGPGFPLMNGRYR